MHCKSPRQFLKRRYHNRRVNKRPLGPWSTVPNTFPTPRLSQVKALPDKDYIAIHDSLLAKDHLIIS